MGYLWLGLKDKDKLQRLVSGKYLKQLLTLHERAGTLEIPKEEITILCRIRFLPEICDHWGMAIENSHAFALKAFWYIRAKMGNGVSKGR
jgi:hypothetical protein